MSILGNLMRNLENQIKDRLVNKFVESDHAKTDRLLELHFKYAEQVQKSEAKIEEENSMLRSEGMEEIDEEMTYIRKLELGLFTLQQVNSMFRI